MEFLIQVLVFVHLIGMAAVLGGFLLQTRADPRRILTMQWHGILTQVVTGVLLAGVMPQVDEVAGTAFYPKISVKLLLALAALVLVAANRKRDRITTGVWAAIGVIELLNLAIAIFWTI